MQQTFADAVIGTSAKCRVTEGYKCKKDGYRGFLENMVPWLRF